MNTDRFHPLVQLIDRLSLHSSLSSEDRVSLFELPYSLKLFEAKRFLSSKGDATDHCHLLISGVAYRYSVSDEGLRQIVGIHTPGEFLDLQQLYVGTVESDVRSLIRCEVAAISHGLLRQLTEERPSIGNALFTSMLVELSIAREWMLNIGRRDARTRLAHFLCEFAFRISSRGLTFEKKYEMPMTQEQLADCFGLTAVHVNRTFKGLVRDGLVERSKNGITIPNWEALVQTAGFNDRYLTLRNRTSPQY